ncbi:head-tail connector protein [Actinoplanes oblitus]|uniref:Head-tail connector protein n=1 Tax=Actinoplanes oblitus TaxID=3040509 RepID=A0ABY8WIY2_9ACTN|nr:head-tail connector protein [Actinoplanes oblitus]WIM97836.1 head-tail connector protein [Actinoplanes oblitus]
MATYDLGDGVPLEHEVRNADNVLTNATVAVVLNRPDGTTFPAPTITNPSTGIYRAVPVPDAVGTWIGAWSTSGAVTSVQPFSFAVGDPGPQDYAALPMVKAALGKTTADDRDDLIQQAITAASRLIDRRCGRRFYADKVATARTFPVCGQSAYAGVDQVILVDDIATLTGVTVETGTTGSYTAASGWEAGPDNAAVYGRPYTELRAGAGWLPATGRVRVTARWGWPTVPDEIAQACLLLAARFYRRKDSPQGVLGSAEWGVARVSRTDPDVEALIAPFVIPTIA